MNQRQMPCSKLAIKNNLAYAQHIKTLIMNTTSKKDKAISAWWLIQGVVFTAIFAIAIYQQAKPPVWALTFGIILCLAAYLRRKGDTMRRIADMVLLAYTISFGIIACLLIMLDSFKQWFVITLAVSTVINIAASLASFRRKKKQKQHE